MKTPVLLIYWYIKKTYMIERNDELVIIQTSKTGGIRMEEPVHCAIFLKVFKEPLLLKKT